MRTAACATLLAVSLAAACGQQHGTQSSGTSADATASSKTVPMHASWARYYTDMPSLLKDSDLVIVGTVSENLKPMLHKKSKNDPGYLATESVIEVSKVLANSGHEAASPSKVTVVQTGGKTAGAVYEIDDYAIFRPKEQLVLFLDHNGDGTYSVAGGPSGRFELSGGMVSAAVKNGVRVQNVAMSKFEQMVDNAS